MKVSELMHKGNEMPLVPETATMQEALLEMTSKMLGCVGITDTGGHLKGIITDGDLRRKMSNDILNKKAAEVMTPNPKTTVPDILAARGAENHELHRQRHHHAVCYRKRQAGRHYSHARLPASRSGIV